MMKHIRWRAFCLIALACVSGAFIINILLLLMLTPHILGLYGALTDTAHKGETTAADISYLMIFLNLRFYVALNVSSVLVLGFLLIKKKYYMEWLNAFIGLLLILLLLTRTGLLSVW